MPYKEKVQISTSSGDLFDSVLCVYVLLLYCCSACQYDEETGKVLRCDSLYDRTYLHGYTLDVRVVEYEDGFSFWRGVESCEVHSTIENNISYVFDNVFREKINLYYNRAPYRPTVFHGMILLVLLVFLLYVALYFCRKTHCLICGKKLIFFTQKCFMCRFYGAEMPDPTLIKALGEKGQTLSSADFCKPNELIASVGVMLNDPNDGDICCCDCRRCTARSQIYHHHETKLKKLNKVVPVNVQTMELGKPLVSKIRFQNTSAKVGDIAEMKVEEELIYKAAGHPMYPMPAPAKLNYERPVDPYKVLPPQLGKKKKIMAKT